MRSTSFVRAIFGVVRCPSILHRRASELLSIDVNRYVLFAFVRSKSLVIAGFAVNVAVRMGVEYGIRWGVFIGVRRYSSRACGAGLLVVMCRFIVLLVVGVAIELIAALPSGASLPGTALHAPPMSYLSCGGITRLRVVHPVLLVPDRLAQSGHVPGR